MISMHQSLNVFLTCYIVQVKLNGISKLYIKSCYNTNYKSSRLYKVLIPSMNCFLMRSQINGDFTLTMGFGSQQIDASTS